jgi:hypothetical protein
MLRFIINLLLSMSEGFPENEISSPLQYPQGDYTKPEIRKACYDAAYATLERAKALGAGPGWMYSKETRNKFGLTDDEAQLVLDWAQDQIGEDQPTHTSDN